MGLPQGNAVPLRLLVPPSDQSGITRFNLKLFHSIFGTIFRVLIALILRIFVIELHFMCYHLQFLMRSKIRPYPLVACFFLAIICALHYVIFLVQNLPRGETHFFGIYIKF